MCYFEQNVLMDNGVQFIQFHSSVRVMIPLLSVLVHYHSWKCVLLLLLGAHKDIKINCLTRWKICLFAFLLGGTVVQQLTLVPHSKKLPGSTPVSSQGPSMWSLHWFSPGTPDF